MKAKMIVFMCLLGVPFGSISPSEAVRALQASLVASQKARAKVVVA